MVNAVFPTPPSPNTTSLYSVIFPAILQTNFEDNVYYVSCPQCLSKVWQIESKVLGEKRRVWQICTTKGVRLKKTPTVTSSGLVVVQLDRANVRRNLLVLNREGPDTCGATAASDIE